MVEAPYDESAQCATGFMRCDRNLWIKRIKEDLPLKEDSETEEPLVEELLKQAITSIDETAEAERGTARVDTWRDAKSARIARMKMNLFIFAALLVVFICLRVSK